ncbi:MAG: hypothetical protein F4149_08235, partial [Gammaproteobacteria bacterium]|nr:hypothetical protein [Gammaproteobacteria bacterium]
MRACPSAGSCGCWSAIETTTVPKPGTPTLTAPSSDSDGAYDLSWTRVTDAVRYELEERRPSGNWTSEAKDNRTRISVTTNVSGTHDYRVRACTARTLCGDWSATASVSVTLGTTLAAPTLTVPSTDSDGAFKVSWSNVSDASTYKLQQKVGTGSWTDEYSGSSLEHSVSVSVSGTYSYQVQACPARGSCGGWSTAASVTVTISSTLNAPTLTVPSTDADGIYTVSWASVPGASQYVLQEKTGAGAWADKYTGASLSHDLSGKANGTYSYQVKACTSATNCGAWSSPASVSVGSYAVETPPAANAPNATTLAPTSVRNATDQAGTLEGVFRVSETGSATYRVPLPTAPGTAGVVPDLALAYDSQAGNGLAGLGWRIDGLSSIVRCRQTKHQDGADKAIAWGADDRFCLDGQRLVLVGAGTYGAANTEYRTEVDGGLWVFAKGGTTGNPDYFEARAKDGSVRYYGTAPGNTDQKAKVVLNSKTLAWSIRKFEDNIGNPIWYQYVNDANGQRIDEVRWAYGSSAGPTGYHARLEFDYEDRNDDVTRYVAGQKVVMAKRLQTVKLRNKPVSGATEALLQTIRLRYKSIASLQDETSRLESLEDCAGSNCLPKTTFEWPARASSYQATAQPKVSLKSASDRGLLAVSPADINGDGRLDIVWLEWDADRNSGPDHHLRYGVYVKKAGTNQYAFQPANFITTSTDTHPHRIEYLEDPGTERVDVAVLDYNADGRHDVAVWRTRDRRWMVHLSTPQASGGWALTKTAIDTGLTAQRTVFTDVDGDGLADALYTDDVDAESSGTKSTKTYVRHLRRDTTQPATSNRYYAFQTAAQATLLHTRSPDRSNVNVSSKPVLNGLDFNGDGLADHLIDYVETATSSGPRDAARSELDAQERGIPRDGVQGSSVTLVWRAHQAFIVDSSGTATAYGNVFRDGAVTFHPTDLNGDGLTDLVRESWSGDNLTFHAEVSTGAGFNSHDLGISLVRKNVAFLGLVDDNGDGHPDFTWHDRKAKRIYAYLWDPQTGGFDTSSAARRTVLTTDGKEKRRDLFVDMDGDGGADHIHLDLKDAKAQLRLNANAGSLPNAVTKITNGLGAETQVTYGTLAQSAHYTRLQLGMMGTVSSHVCLNGLTGGGCFDYVTTTVTAQDMGNFYKALNGGWDLPAGSQTLGRQGPVLELRAAVPVVERVSSSAPTGSSRTAKSAVGHYYAEAKLHGGGRGLLGFAQLMTRDEQSGVKVTTSYRQDFPFIGRPLRTVTRSSSGHVLGETSTTWKMRGYQSGWPSTARSSGTAALYPLVVYAAESVEKAYALKSNGAAAGSLYRKVTVATAVDADGNATEVKSVAEGAGSSPAGFETRTVNTYGPLAADRKLGRLTKAVVSKRRRASGSTAWGAALTRTSGFTHYGKTGCPVTSSAHAGMLCTETVEPTGGALKSVTTHRYDAFGNLVRSAVRARGDGGADETRCDFDVREHDKLGRLLTVERDCLGRKVREVSARDAKWGLPTTVKAYLNTAGTAHRTEKAAHTPRGREAFRSPGTGHWETVARSRKRHAQCPAGTAVSEVRKAAGGSESVSCLDVLGREVRVSELGFDGSWSRTEVEYDASGRVSKSWSPHWSADTACEEAGTGSRAHRPKTRCATSRAYDVLGRLTRVTHPDGSTESVVHDGLDTTFTDAKGYATKESRNALGELVTVEDALGGQVRRERRADGHVVKVVREKGSSDSTAAPSKVEWTLARDGLGRVTTSTDPDRGAWAQQWNGFGELIRRTAPSGRYATFAHDGLGRVKARREHGSGGGLELGASWTWDGAANGLGRVNQASESVTGYQRTHSYDALGRPTDVATAYGGAAHYERTTYDEHGRVFQTFDASRESASYTDGGVRRVYNSRGHLRKLQDAVLSGSASRTVYWEALEADASGRVVKERLGNGAVRLRRHDGRTGRLEALTATRPGQASGDLQDLRMEWDLAGNLKRREDLTGSRDVGESFTYDKLHRMETSRVGTGSSSRRSFTYDGYGNLRSKAGVGTYAYFSAHPSRLRTAGSDSFTYDADGSMLTGAGRTMAYDAGGRMKSAVKGSHTVRFVHGPDGHRIKREDASGGTETTLYLGSVEKVTHVDGTRTVRRRIGGMALEVRRLSSGGTETSRATYYLLRDHLGSVSVVADSDASDDAGAADRERSYGPWGLRRNAATWADLNAAQRAALPEGRTLRGFTGHEMADPVGLVHMNGRVYDPRLGRFLQADPYVGDPSNMLSLNRYAYAHGNPLANVDPSGHFVEGLLRIVGIVLAAKRWIDAW